MAIELTVEDPVQSERTRPGPGAGEKDEQARAKGKSMVAGENRSAQEEREREKGVLDLYEVAVGGKAFEHFVFGVTKSAILLGTPLTLQRDGEYNVCAFWERGPGR